ncbi:hypothetical protein CCACVL1_08658 [Corchorus capsularis]|uniref:Uncharacterized protein n=1 Tax=Corchorus capsularis TaxID=210143 RepID=A0A1R3IZD3_COCAP|nr:hypothetical protein CCACVL1_08658 [Corchorus capsularis]
MERSRSKRNYYYDQDYDGETMGRTKPRYNNHHYIPNNHRHRGNNPNNNGGNNGRPSNKGGSGGGGGGGGQDSSLMVTTSYRILCHDMKAGGVIGKSGSIIKSIRQHTGAWINVHELIPGDEERIIEISDTRRRDPDGRMPSFSPAQEALFLIHERILESDSQFGFGGGGLEEEEDYGGVVRGGGNRVATRLVVSRMHVGCLLGKGGKIIEQMRMETKTQIRILPRDHTLPRCVTMAEEIVQVVGDMNAVKNAIAIISSRLRESQHRDRSHFHGRMHSPERFFPDDDYMPHLNNASRRSAMDGPSFGSRMSNTNYRGNNYSSRPSGFIEAGTAPMADTAQPLYGEDLVFRILCPIDKVDSVFGEPDGIVDLLQNEIGVDVKVADPVAGSDEQIITISSEEGPDDELFPAQEALLHIQTQIVDLVPDKDNIVTTRLLVPSSEIGCLEGRDGSFSEMKRLTGANIQILSRQELPSCVSGPDEIVQIVGEIKAAREALIEVTSRLRSYLYREFFQKGTPPPPISAASSHGNVSGLENASPNLTPARDSQTASDPPTGTCQNVQPLATAPSSKEVVNSGTETVKQTETERREDVPSTISRIPVTLVTRSTLEVVIPEHAIPKLITKSKNKLAQISELSGANVTLVEDRPDDTQKIIQISGTPEQSERAQSLLQGFILSSAKQFVCLFTLVTSILDHVCRKGGESSIVNVTSGALGLRTSLNLHSQQWHKSISCFSVSLPTSKSNLKLYMIPTIPTVTRHFLLKPFAAVDSLEAHVSPDHTHAVSGVSSQNGFQRSNTFLDKASNSWDGTSDFERQLEELFNEVKTLIMAGNKNDAIDLLQANHEVVKEQMNAGAKGIEEAAILDVIALGYMAVGELKFVRSLLNVIFEVIVDLKDDEPLLDSILVHMGSMYTALGEFKKSMLVNQRVTGILENRHGKNSVVLVTPLLGMAKVLSSTGRTKKAVKFYHRVISILESSKGAESEDLVVPLLGLGNLLIKEGRATDAENSFSRILNIYTKLYGENDGRVALAMCSLAHAKCAEGNANEAIDLYKKALQIIKGSSYMPIDDRIMENMRIDLAELLHAVGRGREGRELLEECLLITEKLKGKDHPTLVTHYVNLAASYSQSKDFAMAERLLRTSLEIIKKAEGPDNPSITFPMLNLAVTLYHLKRDEEAEQFALEALCIREKAFGRESLPAGEALDCLISIQARLGKSEVELLEQLKRVLRIQEKEFGYDSEEVMITLKKLVFYLDKLVAAEDSKASDKDLVQELCKRTSNSTLCSTVIKSDPRSKSTSDYRGFLGIILDQILPTTKATKAYLVDLLKKNTTDKVTHECLQICNRLYDEAIEDLNSAMGLVYFKNREGYIYLNDALGSFLHEFLDCENTFKEPPSRPSPITSVDNHLVNIGLIALDIVNLIECNHIAFCSEA